MKFEITEFERFCIEQEQKIQEERDELREMAEFYALLKYIDQKFQQIRESIEQYKLKKLFREKEREQKNEEHNAV